jgi:hypothetical protein
MELMFRKGHLSEEVTVARNSLAHRRKIEWDYVVGTGAPSGNPDVRTQEQTGKDFTAHESTCLWKSNRGRAGGKEAWEDESIQSQKTVVEDARRAWDAAWKTMLGKVPTHHHGHGRIACGYKLTMPLAHLHDCSHKPELAPVSTEICYTWHHRRLCCEELEGIATRLAKQLDSVSSTSEWEQQTLLPTASLKAQQLAGWMGESCWDFGSSGQPMGYAG